MQYYVEFDPNTHLMNYVGSTESEPNEDERIFFRIGSHPTPIRSIPEAYCVFSKGIVVPIDNNGIAIIPKGLPQSMRMIQIKFVEGEYIYYSLNTIRLRPKEIGVQPIPPVVDDGGIGVLK